MKILTPSLHGYIDYSTVLIFLAAPSVLGLVGLAALFAYALAAIHLLMTFLTNFPLGAVKVIPFPIHGWVERIVGPVLVIASFVPRLAFDGTAQAFYVVMGVVIILVGLLTNYEAS
jgi:hypothetical protein